MEGKKSRCLVTGGSGFCGRAIVKRLCELGREVVVFDTNTWEEGKSWIGGHQVRVVRGSVLDQEVLREALFGVDEVYHCAGQLGTHELFWMNQKAIDVNVKGTVGVLEACRDTGVRKFMYPTKPYAWCNTYTVTKQCGEEFVRMFGKVHGLDVAILRWLNVYGPEQKVLPVRKAIPLMCVQALEGYPVEIFGSGGAIVDLVFTEDMAKVTVDYTGLSKDGDTTKRDVGCVAQMTVNEMAEAIVKATGSKSEIRRIPMRMGEDSDDPKEPLDSFSANQVLGGKYVMTPFSEGLEKTIEWYEGVGHEFRKRCLEFYRCERS